jgi:DNA-binding NarL/FixJ family response regulator
VRKTVDGQVVLSVREAQVLQLLCEDAPTDKEIALRLKLGERTVCDYMRAMRVGLNIWTRGGLIIWGLQHPQAFYAVPVEPGFHGRQCACGSLVCAGRRAA